MNMLEKIMEADGFTLTVTGIGTVFLTLICIWLFIAIYSKISEIISDRDITVDKNQDKIKLNTFESTRKPLHSGELPNESKESNMTMPLIADDSIPKMVAAAAVSVYIKRRNDKLLALLPKSFGSNPWAMSARFESLRNKPSRNNWKPGK